MSSQKDWIELPQRQCSCALKTFSTVHVFVLSFSHVNTKHGCRYGEGNLSILKTRESKLFESRFFFFCLNWQGWCLLSAGPTWMSLTWIVLTKLQHRKKSNSLAQFLHRNSVKICDLFCDRSNCNRCHLIFSCRELAQIFDIAEYREDLKAGILVDLYFYSIQFCRDNNFTQEQTSALFSIIKKTHEICIGNFLSKLTIICSRHIWWNFANANRAVNF